MYNNELVNIKIIFCCTLIWFGERLKITTFKNHPVRVTLLVQIIKLNMFCVMMNLNIEMPKMGITLFRWK